MSGRNEFDELSHAFVAVSRRSRPTVLDLPQSLLEEVILHLRRMIRWDGYLIDLRLVSRQFNEAILHCLLYRGERRRFHSHYMSCPGGCPEWLRDESTGCNPTYARFHMQSYIFSCSERDPELLIFHRNINECLKVFGDILKQKPNSFRVARAFLSDQARFQTASSIPALQDKHIHALSEAVMIYLDTCHNVRRLWEWQLDSHTKHTLPQHSSLFWLQCLACYFSDSELLTWATERAKCVGEVCDEVSIEHGHLLGVLASCGNLELFEQGVRNTPSGASPTFSLRGACLSGSMPIANRVLGAIPPKYLSDVCPKILARLGGGRSLPHRYSDVAEEILKHCGDMKDTTILSILLAQADLGASSVVRLLITKYSVRIHHSAFRILKWQWTPIFAACVNRDIKMLRDVANSGYFDLDIDPRCINEVYLKCEEVAARVNSLEILEQLCVFQNKELHDVKLPVLAAIDGSISIMARRLEAHPEWLQDRTEGNEMSPALGSAIERFRVKNAQFLLERGTQFDEEKDHPKGMDFRYKRAHEQEFQEMSAFLQENNLAHLFKVSDWC